MYQIIKQILHTSIKTDTPPSQTMHCELMSNNYKKNFCSMSVVHWPYATSMRAPATAANWGYTHSTTLITTLKAWVYILSPARAMPICCW